MLKIEQVTKRYGDSVILENASYTFPEQGLVCLMGASGSGKTTLLNLIAGFDSDYEGTIFSCGRDISGLDRDGLCAYRRGCVGFVFQNYHLLSGQSVLENVLAPAELSGDEPEVSEQRAKALLERIGLADKSGQNVETLSGGQKQRVAIARALMGDPQLILADEPTGALDRRTSNEIMELLRELSAERLVLVITHDAKVCEFADEVIHIQDKGIAAETVTLERRSVSREVKAASTGAADGDAGQERSESNAAGSRSETTMRVAEGQPGNEPAGKSHIDIIPVSGTPRKRAVRNFRGHLKRYVASAAAISVGVLAVLFALSFGNVMDLEILAFQEKNTVFNNGYIKGADDGTILAILQEDSRIKNAYYQYKLENITLSMHEDRVDETADAGASDAGAQSAAGTTDTDGATAAHTEVMAEKLPMPKTTESLSYGVMPRCGENEIALTPSLSKKFAGDIRSLLGTTLVLSVNNVDYELTVSGIYNAGYDDFFVSSDVEQQMYEGLPEQDNYSISYDVAEFEDIVAVSNMLELRGISASNAAAEVYTMQQSFRSLARLFRIIAVLVLFLALFLCAVLLVKQQNSRYRELGLLSALGFRARYITSMIRWENLFLSVFSAGITAVLLVLSAVVCRLFDFPLQVGALQFLVCMAGAFAVVIGISTLASVKLIRTEPAEALRHQ